MESRFLGTASPSLRGLTPADVSTQSPRDLKIVSAHRGLKLKGKSACGGGGGKARYSLPSFTGLITQYTMSCPAGPVILNHPCAAGTMYSFCASMRLSAPVSDRGNSSSYAPDVP